MRFFDRFTRDEVSAKVWWPLALLGLIALVGSVPLANRAADQARIDAATSAAVVSKARIEPLTAAGASTAEISAAASAIVAADPTWSAVRVWNTQHNLTVSSDSSDQLNSSEAMNDSDIDRALTAGAVWLVTNRTLSGDEGPATFDAYTAIKGTGGNVVTQFEALDATVLTDVHHFWMWFRIVAGLGTLFVFALALLSMREPLARIGAGVPFYPENVPPWLRVVDVDRAVALEQAGDRAKDRLAGLQARLEESERLRLKAEGELQQALTALGTRGRMPAPLVVPEAEPASGPSPEAAAAAAAAEENKRARAAAAAEKQRAKAAAAEEQQQRAGAAVAAAQPESTAPARPDDVTVRSDDLGITATPEPESEMEMGRHARSDVVVVPEPEPAPVTAGAASAAPAEDHDARDVLERLVHEPVEHEPVDDTQDLRSRLARTAALKKPGSRERQESREEQER